jgi:glycosyltransferase involved in cell wall biosynthesis
MGIERDDGATNNYRIMQPLYKLQQHGMANVCTAREGIELNQEHAQLKAAESDIIVFHRPQSENWFKFIKTCNKLGKMVVCDYDDDPFNTSPLNPFYQWIGTEEVIWKWPDGREEMLWSKDPTEHGGRYIDIEENIRRRDLFRASFRSADLVSCTTDILAEKLRTINPNVAVLPNLIDFDQYPKVEMVKKNIRIGWQGGVSHFEDLLMIRNAIGDILKKYPNVTFVYWGDMKLYGMFREFPIDRVEAHLWSDYMVYPYKLACLNLDIGLCPVVENEFNRNKSAIKYFEYSVSNIASIASDWPPYSPCITNGKDGLLVKPDQWFGAMEELILDETKRRNLAKNAYENIYENHNADKFAYKWQEAYEGVLKKDLVEA